MRTANMKRTLDQEELHLFMVVDVFEQTLFELLVFEVRVIVREFPDEFDRKLLPHEMLTIEVPSPSGILGALIPHACEVASGGIRQERPPSLGLEPLRYVERLEQ